MSAIPYLVKNGDTLDSIASELGISDSYDLRNYHNANSEINKGLGADVEAGNTLLTPPQEKIDSLNAKRTDQEESPVSEAKEEQEEKNEDKKEEEKEEEKKEEAKSEHDGEYYVVDKAECWCSMAEMGEKKTAKLLVTSHQKVILNDEKDKYFATEIDKTFDPPAATFGKCKMQPSSSGYLPCTLSAGPKWDNSYEKTKVLGNKVLTMKSILKCVPYNGEIKIAKHGQTDAVMKEHAENTNAAAMALINSGVKMLEPQIRYPSVKNITLKSLKNNDTFKPVSSEKPNNVKKVTIRPKQECTFEAKITEGNVNLTSWVIYDGFTGDKDKRLFAEEQIGISFKYTFPTPGKYRVEGYGKPKNDEFNKGANNKNYPDCSLDIEVVENTLIGTELLPIDGENFFKVIRGKKRIRQNFPANFQAKFLMVPTDEELKELKFYVTDGQGNGLKSTVVNNSVAFTPTNTNAPYHFKAEYKTVSGEVLKQSFSAQTVPNSVASINDNNPEKIRAGTPMTFSVKEGTFSYYIPNDEKAETAINKEFQEVKWNLNGRLLGTGKSITIPGNQFLVKGKYVVEAFVMKANAYGTESVADEPDDWRFEVIDNDVMSFSYIEVPKVGKTTKLQADSFVFAKLTDVEKVVWNLAIPHKTVDKNTISITPVAAGKQKVKCSINHREGKTLSVDVKQAKVLETLFTDSNGIEIQKASWGQKINIWIKQEYLLGEEIKVEVWDDDTTSADDRVATFTKPSYDGGLISFVLSPKVKEETGTNGKLYVRVTAPKLKLGNANNVFESKNFLDVQDKRELYAAHIGSQDGTMRHYHVDYNQVSYFYAKSRGIDPKEQLNLTIYEKDKAVLEAKNVHVDDSGMIKIKLEWNQVSLKLPMRVVHAVLKDKNGNVLHNGSKTGAGVALTKKSALQGLVEYKSAVFVGSGGAGGAEKNKTGTCECESYNLYYGKKVNCDFRKKVIEISKKLWPKNYKEMANGLMAVMHRETSGTLAANQLEGYKSLIDRDKMTKDIFNKTNPKTGERSSRAVGLIQFTQDSLVQMKEFKNGDGFDKLHELKLSYARMKEVEQLEKVKEYMKAVKSLPKIPEDIYVAVFAPFYVGDSMDTIMYKKGTNSYISNASLDKNDDGIQIKELLGEFRTSLAGGIAYSKYKCENSGTNNLEATEGQSEYYIYKTGKIKLIKGTLKKSAYYVEKTNGKFKLLYVLEENSFGVVEIPASGNGFDRYSEFPDVGGVSKGETVGKGDHYLLPTTAAALFGIINEISEKSWEIHLGDMSSENGSDPWGPGSKHHAGHGHLGTRKGLDIDFRYLNKSGKSYQGNNTSSVFDKEKNKEVFNLAHKYGFRSNYCTNVNSVFGENIAGVKNVISHIDHGHFGLSNIDLEEVKLINVIKI